MKVRIPNSGGPGNMNQMIKQAQKMQEDMANLQADLDTREYTATSGGGAVTVIVDGKHLIKSLKINPDIIDPDDAEMISDYIFGNIVSNPAYNYSEKANMPLGILIYTIPKMLRAKLNNDTIKTIATNWAENRIAAQEVIDITINR